MTRRYSANLQDCQLGSAGGELGLPVPHDGLPRILDRTARLLRFPRRHTPLPTQHKCWRPARWRPFVARPTTHLRQPRQRRLGRRRLSDRGTRLGQPLLPPSRRAEVPIRRRGLRRIARTPRLLSGRPQGVFPTPVGRMRPRTTAIPAEPGRPAATAPSALGLRTTTTRLPSCFTSASARSIAPTHRFLCALRALCGESFFFTPPSASPGARPSRRGWRSCNPARSGTSAGGGRSPAPGCRG